MNKNMECVPIALAFFLRAMTSLLKQAGTGVAADIYCRNYSPCPISIFQKVRPKVLILIVSTPIHSLIDCLKRRVGILGER